jgi:hypothetical protein
MPAVLTGGFKLAQFAVGSRSSIDSGNSLSFSENPLVRRAYKALLIR